MIMAGSAFKNSIPFKNVYFTGIVRDKKRRKMSKSLGNSPDALELIEKYGADGVRSACFLQMQEMIYYLMSYYVNKVEILAIKFGMHLD